MMDELQTIWNWQCPNLSTILAHAWGIKENNSKMSATIASVQLGFKPSTSWTQVQGICYKTNWLVCFIWHQACDTTSDSHLKLFLTTCFQRNFWWPYRNNATYIHNSPLQLFCCYGLHRCDTT
jgi:hypothetical protein